MCQDTGPCCQRPYQSWPAISRAGDACVAWAKQARQEKVILLTNQQADAWARGRVGEIRNSELPGAKLTQTSEVARSAQLSVSEVLGVGKGSRWGANMGEQRGARHPPCHSSVHGCSPREAAAVPARINLGIVSGWRWRW